AVADDDTVIVGRRLDGDLALLHVEQHRLRIALEGRSPAAAAGRRHQDDVAGIERHHVGIAEIDRVVALAVAPEAGGGAWSAAVAAPRRKARAVAVARR